MKRGKVNLLINIMAYLYFVITGVVACFLYMSEYGSPLNKNSNNTFELSVEKESSHDTRFDLPEKEELSVQETKHDMVQGVIGEDTEVLEEVNTEETVLPQIQYYSFNTNTSSLLRVRKEPSLEADILGNLPPQTKGYVLEYGDTWSLVVTGVITGYVFNEYLTITKITEEDYPDEYKKDVLSRVEDSDEIR